MHDLACGNGFLRGDGRARDGCGTHQDRRAGRHSGDLASYGVPSLNAAKLVIDEVNAKGGILGRQLELVAQDDQCKPELATSAATKLIS